MRMFRVIYMYYMYEFVCVYAHAIIKTDHVVYGYKSDNCWPNNKNKNNYFSSSNPSFLIHGSIDVKFMKHVHTNNRNGTRRNHFYHMAFYIYMKCINFN